MDPEITAALEEAYASAPDIPVWHTLELNHPTFPEPARVILDHGEMLSEDPVAWGRRLRLEADAPADAGELVTFLAAGISITLPGYKEGQQPELTISVDNVSGSLVPLLKSAIALAEPISVYYREYLANDPDTVHWRLRGMTLRKVTATTARIEGAAAFSDLHERIFGRTYTVEEFPALASR